MYASNRSLHKGVLQSISCNALLFGYYIVGVSMEILELCKQLNTFILLVLSILESLDLISVFYLIGKGIRINLEARILVQCFYLKNKEIYELEFTEKWEIY